MAPGTPGQKVTHVCLGSALLPVGKLQFTQRSRRHHSEFQYFESWLNDARAFAIEPHLPLGLTPSYVSKASTGDQRDSLPSVLHPCRGARIFARRSPYINDLAMKLSTYLCAV